MLKKTFYTFLLTAYLLYSFEFLLPYLDYIINFEYIISNLCEQKDEEVNMCMGGCYLEKEMEKKDNEKDETASFKENTQQTLYCVTAQSVILIVDCTKFNFHVHDSTVIDFPLPVVTPPPRA